MAMRLLDLFSGIGGFSYAAETLIGGYETVAFCEMDEFCQKVLKKHWPQVPIFDDVRTLDAARLGRIDIVTGGYPCQPFSQAGRRQGEEDERHLWPEMLRIIKSCQPRYVLAENVAGHVTMGLDQVLTDLEDQGYTTRPIIVPACAKNAPHRRDRVWIIGQLTTNTNDTGNRTSRSYVDQEQQTIEQGWKEQSLFEFSRHDEAMADTDKWQSRSGDESKSDETQQLKSSTDSTSERGIVADSKIKQSNESTNDTRFSEKKQGEFRRSGCKENVTDSESKGLAHSNEREICISKQSGMDSNEKGNRSKVRSKSTRRNKLSTENVTNTDNEGLQRHGEHRQVEREHGQRQSTENHLQNEHRTNRKFEQRVGDMADGLSTGLLRHFDREPEHIPRVTKGEKDRAKKLKALGNSIVPQVAAEILLAIRISEESD